MIQVGAFIFRYRNVLGPVVLVLALVLSHPAYPFGRSDLNTLFDLVGVAVALMGQILRGATIGYQYIIRGGRNRRVYAETLVDTGIFALCRNPLYVGNLLIAVGFTLVVHSYAFYFILLPGVAFAYIAIVAAEEAYLRQKFGQQYEDYMRRVPRWWPRLSRFPDAVAGFPFNWRRVIVKEYNTTFVLCATLTCLYFWSEYSVVGSAALPSKVSAAGAAAVWAVLYLAVRAAKKTGYLQDRTALTT